MAKTASTISLIAFILLVIGGINWGLIGIFNFNPVAFIFHSIPIVERIIYILVGISALYLIYGRRK